MSESRARPRLPPRWFIRLFWFTHRRVYRLTGGRWGLWRPKPNGWGAARLTVVGRRTDRSHEVPDGTHRQPGSNAASWSATSRMGRTSSRWR